MEQNANVQLHAFKDRESDKWGFSNIKNRYKSFYKYIPVATVVGAYKLAKGALSFFGGS